MVALRAGWGSLGRSLVRVWLCALAMLGVPSLAAAQSAAAGRSSLCGPAHEREVREVLRLRNPGASANARGGALWLDRALIVDDFLRLQAAHRAARVEFPAPRIDDNLLRRHRDNGLTTPEVCAVVHYMHAYYTNRAAATSPSVATAEAQAPASEPEPERVTAARSTPVPGETRAAEPAPSPEPVAVPVPRPTAMLEQARAPEPATPERVAALQPAPVLEQSRALEPAPAAPAEPEQTPTVALGPAQPPAVPLKRPPDLGESSPAEAEDYTPAVPHPKPAPAPAPAPAPSFATPGSSAAPEATEAATRKAEAEALRLARQRADERIGAALPWITELEDQLNVPRYLSFRETRVETPSLAEDEVKERREASLRAMDRVVVLLSLMKDDPELRRAVQTTLGPQGRARVDQALRHTVRSVPDLEQAVWALELWNSLEASARAGR